jgi:hypothetical protein
MNEDQQVAEYTRSVGHPPRNREDDPDWNYRGTKEELEELKRKMGLSDEPEMIPGQMEIA